MSGHLTLSCGPVLAFLNALYMEIRSLFIGAGHAHRESREPSFAHIAIVTHKNCSRLVPLAYLRPGWTEVIMQRMHA